MTELLRVEDLRVHFQARKGLIGTIPVKALDGVSLTLDKGETLAVVGESGSGKTTLGRAALRLLKPTGGRIFFDGEDVTNLPTGCRFHPRCPLAFEPCDRESPPAFPIEGEEGHEARCWLLGSTSMS